jgi:replicative DNA helicase
MSHGLSLLRSLIEAGARSEFRQVRPSLFLETELPAFHYVSRFYREHGALPSTTAMAEAGFILPRVDNPVSYYIERCTQRAMYNSVVNHQAELADAMQRRDMARVAEIVNAQARAVSSMATQQDVHTLTQLVSEVLEDYEHAHAHPGMQGMTLGWGVLDDITGGIEGGDVVTFAARPGMGKAQPLDEPVLLADGTWRTMGALVTGDKLASVVAVGVENRVVAVHDRGDLPVYRVTFEDGRSTRVCGDHLWEVSSCRWGWEGCILSTSDLIALQNGRAKNRLFVPLVDGDFGSEHAPVDAWVLGMIIGDGCVTSRDVTVTMADTESVLRMQAAMVPGYDVVPMSRSSKFGYRLTHGHKGAANIYADALRQLGLWGCGAKEKRLPETVFEWTKDDRLALLRGIMDSDGWVQNGKALLGLTNAGLMADVRRLVRSLGGQMTIHSTRANGSVRGVVTTRDNPFTLSRKAVRYIPRSRSPVDQIRIIDIQPEGVQPCRCISVSHPTRLYVTRDYIVTHNSWLLGHIAARAWEAGNSVLLVSMEMTGKQLARRILGMRAGVNPNHIRRGQLSNWSRDVVYQQLDLITGGVPFHILSGSFDKSVPLVDAAIQEFAPALVLIDASYLMDPSEKRKQGKLFESLTDVAKEIKQCAMSRNKGIIQTVQFNRDASKAKTRGTQHIGGSDAVGQITTIGIDIQQGGAPHETSRRKLTVFKNREGEDSYSFDINFLFQPPDFSYIPPIGGTDTAAVEDHETLETMGGI